MQDSTISEGETGGAESDGAASAPSQIQDHRLVGVEFIPTPNMAGEIKPRYLIIHYTASGSLTGTVKHFQKEKNEVSAHLVIGRDGRVVQMVPFNRAAWHAGISQWGDVRSLNGHSIGIEIVNWGLLETDADGNPYSWASTSIPPEETKAVHDEVADRLFVWHKYTTEQLEVVFNVSRILVQHYGLEAVLGHYDVSPGRKIDPGPLFPMEELRKYCYELPA